MKHTFCAIFLSVGLAVFSFAAGIAEEARRGNEKADMSYAFGMIVAMDLEQTGLDFNYDAFALGFRDAMEREATRFTMEEAIEKIDAAFETFNTEVGELNRIEGDAFLDSNGRRLAVVTTDSGLQYEMVTEGSGESPGPMDMVRVHYEGQLINGTVFDSSYERDEPVEFHLYRVIPGWSEGLQMMREGGKAILYIPPDIAYGERGIGEIGPNAVIIFHVELLEIIKP